MFDILIDVANFGYMWGLMVCLSNFVGSYGIKDKFIEFLYVPNGKINTKIVILRLAENFGITAPPSAAIIKAPYVYNP